MGLELTYDPGSTQTVLIHQGKAKPINTSKTLLPMVLETAMSPWP